MRSIPSLMPVLLIGASLLLAPGCADRVQAFPPSADLRPEPKPQLDPAAIESEAALDAHDIAIETWGERGWDALARVCQWAVDMGAEIPFACRPPEEPG